MEVFLSGAALFIAFGALIYAGALGNRLDANPVKRVDEKIEDLTTTVNIIEKTLLDQIELMSERISDLEKAPSLKETRPKEASSEDASMEGANLKAAILKETSKPKQPTKSDGPPPTFAPGSGTE